MGKWSWHFMFEDAPSRIRLLVATKPKPGQQQNGCDTKTVINVTHASLSKFMSHT